MTPNHADQGAPPCDRDIRPGDVCRDTAQDDWVVVIRKVADDIADYVEDREQVLKTGGSRHLLDYAGNWLTGADSDTPVWKVVYLPDDGLTSFPDSTYDFPETRLARLPVEQSRDDILWPLYEAAMADAVRRILDAAGMTSDSLDAAGIEDAAERADDILEVAVRQADLGWAIERQDRLDRADPNYPDDDEDDEDDEDAADPDYHPEETA